MTGLPVKSILLAGGLGTRLKGVIGDAPKPMAPVKDRPFLEYIINFIASQGMSDIMISVGHKHEVIEDHFGDGSSFGVNISYCREMSPLGTGGAIREAMKLADSSHCLILNGDTFNAIDFKEMNQFHLSQGNILTMGLIFVDNAGRYGSVGMDGTGRITGFHEKKGAGPGYINCGAYIAHRGLLDRMPDGRFSFETDLLPHILDLGISGFVSRGFFIDIGIPETYRYINEHAHILAGACRGPGNDPRRQTGAGQ